MGATQLTQHLATPPAAPISIMHASSGGGVSTSITPARPTILDLFTVQQNAQAYAAQHPINPPTAALAIDDADDYDDLEEDDDYADAMSMYGGPISHAITQQQQTEEDKK